MNAEDTFPHRGCVRFITSVAGFATLGLSTMPQLQQFGVLVALAMVYAFLSTVLVLPSLFVLWNRRLLFFAPGTYSYGFRLPGSQRSPLPSSRAHTPERWIRSPSPFPPP